MCVCRKRGGGKCAYVWERSLTGCESGCCGGSVHVCVGKMFDRV